ncbi:MAG: methionine--tRNA ligase [Candidatus Coatesbacteria bacterium]|nr:methionine--tRNA ligase [Candidatus Coatesbacteria bacterium]
MNKMTVTMALPYANGEIHLGHLIEAIQTDIWVRFQKMTGNECHFFAGDDSHGTAIMIAARKNKMKPEEFIESVRKRHIADYKLFNIKFDNYYTTHSKENEEFTLNFYRSALKKGMVKNKTIEMLFCPSDGIFLPDRFIKGTCPKCGAEDQYGDSCDTCGATYTPSEITDAHCSFCGTSPVKKEAVHYFFDLRMLSEELKSWINSDALSESVKKKMMEWFYEGLREWDFSRDAPFFGFRIPDSDDKYFYNWWDAPIGYLASIKNWCERENKDFSEHFENKSRQLIHFIGKDIQYFHCLFWPAMLITADYRLPDKVYIHGFLQIDGKKMSKSKGTFILAKTFAEYIKNTDYLRYYYASKLTSSIEDMNMGIEDFVNKINSEIVGKIVNLGSRSIPMLHKYFAGKLSILEKEDREILDNFTKIKEAIARYYAELNFSQIIRDIVSMADEANIFIDKAAPWLTIKTDKKKAHRDLTTCINIFRILVLYLKPIIPVISRNAEKMLRIEDFKWEDIEKYMENCEINNYEHLAQRVDIKTMEQIMDASKEPPPLQKPASNLKKEIEYEDFAKVDLRIAEIKGVEEVDGADKLLKLILDIGFKKVTVFAGIKEAYDREKLLGKKVILVANLKPKKMKFGTSNGMILATGSGGKDIFMITVDEGASAGMIVE